MMLLLFYILNIKYSNNGDVGEIIIQKPQHQHNLLIHQTIRI
jgi:hypothetical protein